jgi:hypothetical protein
LKEELDKVFNDLQDSIVKQAAIYKDTKFDLFYRFSIGEVDFNECIDSIIKNLEGENRNDR